jgi:hypothetical protein
MATMTEYGRGAERLLDFLAGEFDRNGASRTRPDDVQLYYKMPAVLAYGGRRELALRTLEQFERRFLHGSRFVLENDPVAAPWAAYLAGWFAWGAGALGRFDLARRVMVAVLSRQDAAHGGFSHQDAKGTVFDTERSSAAAMGCVWAMYPDNAKAAARFLDHALAGQPKAGCFFAYFDSGGRAIPVLDDRNAYFALDDPHARPALFATTLAALIWLGRASDDAAYFGLADRYMRLILSHRNDAAKMPLATKTAWAALMLNRHLPDGALTAFARRSGDDLLARQQPDGSIDFDDVPDVPKPIDKVWHIGWGCDVALTLLALEQATA